MNLQLRLETPADYRAVEELTREAFWINTDSNPFIDEHLLVHNLRGKPCFIPELDFVVDINGILVGNVMYSHAKIVAPDATETEVLTFVPSSVLPEYQSNGIGRKLMLHSIAEAKRIGYSAIVFHGHADYYPRFGFKRAFEYGLAHNYDSCMAMELTPNALDIPGGKLQENPVFFNLPEDKAIVFDKSFPPKELRPRIPIEVLLERLDLPAREAILSLNLIYLGKLRNYSERSIAALPGIDERALDILRSTMREHGRIWGETLKKNRGSANASY